MAASYVCDGCGVGVTKPKIVGFVIKREYCRECSIVAKVFLDTQEGYLSEAHAEFVKKRDALIKQYGAKNFKLPDVP